LSLNVTFSNFAFDPYLYPIPPNTAYAMTGGSAKNPSFIAAATAAVLTFLLLN
jgi:hypothetical protein